MATKVELQSELNRLADIERELIAFKGQVRDKAIEVANEQGWCRDGLNEALEELGLEQIPLYQRRTAVISVTYTYDPSNEDDGDGEITRIVVGPENRYATYEIEAWDVDHEEPEDVFDE